jgi:hypothetical protein
MPLKAQTTTLFTVVTTLRLGEDTSMADANLQVVTRGQL